MKLKLIPLIDASYLDYDVEEELIDNEISTHYQDDIVYLDWKEEQYFPLFKKWLVKKFGEDIKQYKNFGISAT